MDYSVEILAYRLNNDNSDLYRLIHENYSNVQNICMGSYKDMEKRACEFFLDYVKQERRERKRRMKKEWDYWMNPNPTIKDVIRHFHEC